MKRIILIAALLICSATSLFAQGDAEEPKVNLPDAVMEQVVRRVVIWNFKPPKQRKVIYFANDNIKNVWLPRIRNIEFNIVDKGEQGYGRSVYFFPEIEKDGKDYVIWLAYGDPSCHARGINSWKFRVYGSRVKLRQGYGGWGSDCSGPNDHA